MTKLFLATTDEGRDDNGICQAEVESSVVAGVAGHIWKRTVNATQTDYSWARCPCYDPAPQIPVLARYGAALEKILDQRCLPEASSLVSSSSEISIKSNFSQPRKSKCHHSVS